MSKMINLDNERISRVKTKILKSVLTKGFKNEATPNFNGAMFVELLGGSFESVNERLNEIPFPSETQAILKAVVKTIDTKVDNYASKKNYQLFSLEADENEDEEKEDEEVAKDAEFELEKGDDPDVDTSSFDSSSTASDNLGDAIKSMCIDLADKQADEIKNLAKTILKLEKIKQDQDLASKKEESGEFVEDSGEEPKDNKDEDGENGGDNPFGDDSSDSGDESGDNPFADGDSGESSGDNEENPFDKEDNGDEGGESSGDNPFEGGDSNGGESSDNPFDDPEEDDKAEAGFESNLEYSDLQIRLLGAPGRVKPLGRLEKGDIVNYAKYISNKVLDSELEKSYASESQEDLTKSMDKYKKLTKSLIFSMTDTLAMGSAIGLRMDMDVVKYPHLYE